MLTASKETFSALEVEAANAASKSSIESISASVKGVDAHTNGGGLSEQTATAAVGDEVGDAVGAMVGDTVGAMVGDAVGAIVGAMVGDKVGDAVGDVVGDGVGRGVGANTTSISRVPDGPADKHPTW